MFLKETISINISYFTNGVYVLKLKWPVKQEQFKVIVK